MKTYGIFIVRKHRPTTIWHRVWGLMIWNGTRIKISFVNWDFYGNGSCRNSKYSLSIKVS